MLKITDLAVTVEDKQVLQGLNLVVNSGEVHVLLGPNGSGKSSLAQTILGNPAYQITQGKIEFNGQDITQASMADRAKLGLALSFQEPPEIKGVTLENLINLIKNNQEKSLLQPEDLALAKDLLLREVNHNFSGGEKKLSEVLQILSLNPKLVIFDELDSGLDLVNLHKILQIIKRDLLANDIPVIFITHHGQIVDGLQPDWTHVMLEKKIICNSEDYQKVINTIRDNGYDKCRQCQFVDR